MEEKITFDRLSTGLKVAIILAWIFGILNLLYILGGIIAGLIS